MLIARQLLASAALSLAGSLALTAHPVAAFTLSAGDLVLSDSGGDRVVRFDPMARELTTIVQAAAGPTRLDIPGGVALADDGSILVIDLGLLYAVDPSTDQLSIELRLSELPVGNGVAVTPTGDFVVGGQDSVGGRVFLMGATATRGGRPPATSVLDVAVGLGGEVYVAGLLRRGAADPLVGGGIWEWDPSAGDAGFRLITSGGSIAFPSGIAVDPRDGSLVVLDPSCDVCLRGDLDQLVRVDPLTGQQTVITSLHRLATGEEHVAVARDGTIFVPGFREILAVDPDDGAQVVLYSNPGSTIEFHGILVVPEPSLPLLLAASFGAVRLAAVRRRDRSTSPLGLRQETP